LRLLEDRLSFENGVRSGKDNRLPFLWKRKHEGSARSADCERHKEIGCCVAGQLFLDDCIPLL
jgi:hypothetical protein